MPPAVVLVTGVSRHLGGRLAALLAGDPSIERVIGVDTVPPPRELTLGRTEFVRADIRNPLIAKVIATAAVDTVVHLNITALPRAAGGRASMKEMNVIGTMQLLAACQKSASVRQLVVKSSTAVYGSSLPGPGAVHRGDGAAVAAPLRVREGRRRDRGLRARLRPPPPRRLGRRAPVHRRDRAGRGQPAAALPARCRWCRPCSASTRGCSCCTTTTRWRCCGWRRSPAGPARSTSAGPGCCCCPRRCAGPGGCRSRCRRRSCASPAGRYAGSGCSTSRREQMGFLEFGRVVDTTRLHTEFGFTPRYDTVAAFDDVVRHRGLGDAGPADRGRGGPRAPSSTRSGRRPRRARPGHRRGVTRG